MGSITDELLDIDKPQEKRTRVSITDDLLTGGYNKGFIEDIPLSSVFTKERMGKQTKPAGSFTHFKAGFVDDPQTQIKIYAASRFPNEPEGKRLGRYGVHNDEIVYLDDDGKLYNETPDTWLQHLKRFAAKTGANLPAIIMSTMGAARGLGPVLLGGAGGEGIRRSIGALALEEPQTAIRNMIDMTKEAALAGAGEKIFGKGISRLVNYVGAKRGGLLAEQAGRGRAMIDPMETARLEKLGKAYGVDLYPPQTTGSKTLADKFNLLGDIEASAPVIQAARKKQVEQVDKAVYNFLDTIAPTTTTPMRAGEKLVEASQKAVKAPILVRQAKAAPLYKKAFSKTTVMDAGKLKSELGINQNKIKVLEAIKPEPDVDAMVKALDERGVPTFEVVKEGAGAHAERISADYKRIIKKEVPTKGGKIDIEKINELKTRNEGIEKALSGNPPKGFDVPQKLFEIDTSDAIKEIDDLMSVTVSQDPSYKALALIKEMIKEASGNLRKLDRVKQSGIDNVLNRTGTTPTLNREMKLVKDKLVSAMDKAVPEYAQARKIFSDFSSEVDRQSKKTIISNLAKLENDQVVLASKKLFKDIATSPETITRAKRAIKQQDPGAWDSAVRIYMQDMFESVKKSATGGITNIGGNFYKAVWGSPKQRSLWKAALDPMQYQNLSGFMEVLERSGMILGRESATATRQVMLEDMGGGQLIKRGIRAATRPLYTKERILGDKLLESILQRNSKRLAEAMTSPSAARQLEKMLKLSPSAEKLIPQVTTFLTMISNGEFSSDDAGRDRIPDVLKMPTEIPGLPRLTR